MKGISCNGTLVQILDSRQVKLHVLTLVPRCHSPHDKLHARTNIARHAPGSQRSMSKACRLKRCPHAVSRICRPQGPEPVYSMCNTPPSDKPELWCLRFVRCLALDLQKGRPRKPHTGRRSHCAHPAPPQHPCAKGRSVKQTQSLRVSFRLNGYLPA